MNLWTVVNGRKKGIYIYLLKNGRYLASVRYPTGYQKGGLFYDYHDAEEFVKQVLGPSCDL